MVNQESQATNRDDQELHSEGVMVSIISCLELHVDQVHSGVWTSDVDDLHGGVVERDERCEQVKVSSGEHQGKQDLTLSRNTGTRPGFPYF